MRKLGIICLFFLFVTAQASTWIKEFEKDNIKVFSKASDQRIIPFKAIAVFDLSESRLLEVLRDYQSKNLWAPKLKSVEMHKELGKEKYIFSEYYKVPWPFYDRQFLLEGEIVEIKGGHRMSAKSINRPQLIDPSHVVASVQKIDVQLKALSAERTEVSFQFEGDMGGWIPGWVSQIIQKRWPYKFLLKLKEQALKKPQG